MEIEKPSPVTLSWSAPEEASCTHPTTGDPTSPTGSIEVEVTGDRVFSMTCTIICASVTKSVTVAINPPVPTLTLSVSPEFAEVGDTVTFTWNSSNTTRCGYHMRGRFIDYGTSGTLLHTLTRVPRKFFLMCHGPGGTVRGSVSVAQRNWQRGIPAGSTCVRRLEAPRRWPPCGPGDIEVYKRGRRAQCYEIVPCPPRVNITFSASPSTIEPPDEYVTITWSVSGTDYPRDRAPCSVNWGRTTWGWRPVGPSGQETIRVNRTHVFTIRCHGYSSRFIEDGLVRSDIERAGKSIIVTMKPLAPSGDFTITPNVIDIGKTATLSWNISNADSCRLHGREVGWRGTSVPTQGTRDTPALNRPGFYTLRCESGRWLSGGIMNITKGYVIQSTDTVPPTAEILLVSYAGWRLPPMQPFWWRKVFWVIFQAEGGYEWELIDGIARRSSGLACLQVRTAWLPEARPPGDYVYTGWRNITSCYTSLSDTMRSLNLQWGLVDPPPTPVRVPIAETRVCVSYVRMRLGGWWGARCLTQGEGACKIEIRAVDMAGNVSEEDREYFNIDWTPPRIEIEEILPPEEPTP